MGKKLYSTDQGGIRFISRRMGQVRIPNYVYDMWLPLLGATAIGVYSMYCRLEREDVVKAITQARIAKACRIGTRKLTEINEVLEECGFIIVTKPEGHKRLMHWTTEIEILEVPEEISQELMQKYQAPSGYECLSTWLVTEKSPNISGEVKDRFDEESVDPSKVVSLGLNPLDVEMAAPVAIAPIVGNEPNLPRQEMPEPFTAAETWDKAVPVEVTHYPEDIEFHCPNPYCDVPIAWSSLKKSKAVCPVCGQYIAGVELGDSAPTWKPPKPKKQKQTLATLLPDINPGYGYLPYYANDAAQLKSLFNKERDLLYNCLQWAVGKVADSNMPEYKAVGAALSLAEKKQRAKTATRTTPTTAQDLKNRFGLTDEELERARNA